MERQRSSRVNRIYTHFAPPQDPVHRYPARNFRSVDTSLRNPHQVPTLYLLGTPKDKQTTSKTLCQTILMESREEERRRDMTHNTPDFEESKISSGIQRGRGSETERFHTPPPLIPLPKRCSCSLCPCSLIIRRMCYSFSRVGYRHCI
jgi:hypothetical protein